MATSGNISPSANEAAQKAIANAMAGGKPGSPSGSSSGAGSGGSSGSGSSGGSSGGSSSSGSGGVPSDGSGGHGGDTGHGPNNPSSNPSSDTGGQTTHGGGMWDNMSPQRWLYLIAMIIVAGCTVFLIMWRTSDKGLEQEAQQKVLDSKELDLKIKKEDVKLARIAALKQQAMVPSADVLPTPEMPRAQPTGCINPADFPPSTRRAPLVLGKGQCLVREDSSGNFWVTFTSAPTSVSGKLGFNELVLETLPDGTPQLRQLGFCLTKDSPDKCMLYLKNMAGNPPGRPSATLNVTNNGRIQINL